MSRPLRHHHHHTAQDLRPPSVRPHVWRLGRGSASRAQQGAAAAVGCGSSVAAAPCTTATATTNSNTTSCPDRLASMAEATAPPQLPLSADGGDGRTRPAAALIDIAALMAAPPVPDAVPALLQQLAGLLEALRRLRVYLFMPSEPGCSLRHRRDAVGAVVAVWSLFARCFIRGRAVGPSASRP